jgi:hypothetical protein
MGREPKGTAMPGSSTEEIVHDFLATGDWDPDFVDIDDAELDLSPPPPPRSNAS